jgi:ABC-2 type transport system permease protein
VRRWISTLFYDIESLLQRYLTKLVRNPTLLATNIATPLLFLFLFSQLLEKLSVFPGVTGSYLTYLTPGIVILNAMTSATLSGVSMVNDLNSGFLSKMLLTQVSRPAILLGRLLTDAFVALIQSVITIVVALALGVTFVTGLPGILLILATVAFFELALSGIFLAIGMRSRKTETISAIGGVLFFPLIFVSSAMFPTSFFPAWAQTISAYNPVSYASDVARDLVQGGLTWSTLVTGYLAIGLIAVLTISATLYQFRKVIS